MSLKTPVPLDQLFRYILCEKNMKKKLKGKFLGYVLMTESYKVFAKLLNPTVFFQIKINVKKMTEH